VLIAQTLSWEQSQKIAFPLMEGQFQSLNRTSAGKRNKASGIVRWPVQEKVTHVASLRFHASF
ncbi:hypothetical protein, partial [uncultured Duncaniella sp.]|uniref:hypothetical protein n=1 Tax=uncultured Duncaniella sp. TaxID=2768039 RepID=UPI0025B23748